MTRKAAREATARTGDEETDAPDAKDEARDRVSSSPRKKGYDAGTGGKDGKSGDEKETRMGRLKANVRTIAGAVALALFIRIVLFEAFEIEGPSMEPTLQNGDRVVVAKFSYGLFLPFTNEAVFTWGMPSRGDVVIVKSPADNIDIVKRVIGLPGDVMELRDDVVYRNGRPIPRRELGPCDPELQMQLSPGCEWIQETNDGRQYRTSGSLVSTPSNMPPRRVPPGHVFILGDHRDHSNDSRYFGPVPVNRVKGHALAIYWSNGPDGLRSGRIFSGVR